jgi:hypothetical protein
MTSRGEDIVILANALRDLVLKDKKTCALVDSILEGRAGSIASFAWQTIKGGPFENPRPLLPIIQRYFWKNREALTQALDTGILADCFADDSTNALIMRLYHAFPKESRKEAVFIVRKLTEKVAPIALKANWDDE